MRRMYLGFCQLLEDERYMNLNCSLKPSPAQLTHRHTSQNKRLFFQDTEFWYGLLHIQQKQLTGVQFKPYFFFFFPNCSNGNVPLLLNSCSSVTSPKILFPFCVLSTLLYYIINHFEAKYVSFIFDPSQHQKFLPLGRTKLKYVHSFIHLTNDYILEMPSQSHLI